MPEPPGSGADPHLDGTAGDRYPHLLRSAEHRWLRSLAGLPLFLLTALACGVVVILGMSLLALAIGGSTERRDELLGGDQPLGLLSTNLVLAMLVPAAVLAVYVGHRANPGWLASVTGRPRWRLLGRFLLLAVPVVGAFLIAGFFIPAGGEATGGSGYGTGTLTAVLAVILLTTPLQAAAEEVGFRGYLSQAVAAFLRHPGAGTVVAAVVSSLLFALAHGTQDGWLFADRLAFGLVASWLAWRTGGLEAAVALHIVNNLVSLGIAALTDTIEDALEISTLDWEYALLDIAMMVTFAVLADRLARRWGVAVRRAAASRHALVRPQDVGYPEDRTPTSPPAGREHPWGMG